MLRWRCDAWVFKPLLIEIIARRKVAPAFEPQKVSGRMAPPRPRTHQGGGRCGSPNNLPGPHFPFQASDNCCDRVAMRGSSSHC